MLIQLRLGKDIRNKESRYYHLRDLQVKDNSSSLFFKAYFSQILPVVKIYKKFAKQLFSQHLHNKTVVKLLFSVVKII